ncbi:hypothetical protein ACIQMP_28710 [Streptomyces sp. NPDC091385]|uniref:hypothetical protein n=1 Tax=Streptomyces sp. NPDC091385 TaxID=3365997 RepID=UPI00382721D1
MANLRMRDETLDAGTRYERARLAVTACRLRHEDGDVDALRSLADSVDWRALDRPEMLRLRRIKNVLTLLRPMSDVLPVDGAVHRELSAWLALIPALP